LKVVSSTHAAITGTLLGSLLNTVDDPFTGITDVHPDLEDNGDYMASISVQTTHGSFQVLVVPAPFVIEEEPN
jgi:hypothetical protein